jgi:hypothetical protein
MRLSRQLLPVVLACIAISACKRGPHVEPQWHYVATGQNGEKFYVDTTTVRASGDERSFTLIAVEAKPKVSFGETYDRTTTDDRVTCAGNTFVLGGVRGYRGDSVVFDNPGESPLPMRPGGPFEAVHRYVCGR